MIGIQGENGLDDVTKSPPDTSLDANSTNSVENRVVTAKFGEVDNRFQKGITINKSFDFTSLDGGIYQYNTWGSDLSSNSPLYHQQGIMLVQKSYVGNAYVTFLSETGKIVTILSSNMSAYLYTDLTKVNANPLS